MKILYLNKSPFKATYEEFTKYSFRKPQRKPQQTQLMKHKGEIKSKIGKRYNYDKMCDVCILYRNVKITTSWSVCFYLFVFKRIFSIIPGIKIGLSSWVWGFV